MKTLEGNVKEYSCDLCNDDFLTKRKESRNRKRENQQK